MHSQQKYDDVIKWKYFLHYWPFVHVIHQPPVNSPHKGQWRGALMFSLICAWTNGWVNNPDIGNLRHHCTHYDITVMSNDESVSWDLTILLNTLRPRQNGHHFADHMFKCIFLNENVWIQIEISLKFVHKGPINNNPALFQIMAWRRSCDKPLSEPMMISWLTHICVNRSQWVNQFK